MHWLLLTKILYFSIFRMEPKSRLNVALLIISVGLLYGRLTALYAPTPSGVQPQSEMADAAALVKPSRRREDAELFSGALAVGLLRPDSQTGRIAIAPADLPLRQRWASDHPDLLTPRGDNEPDWLNGSWDDAVNRLHRALYFSASGRYVRQQIEAFNARRTEFLHLQWRDGRLIWRDRS